MAVNPNVYGAKSSWLPISTGSSVMLANFGDNTSTIAKGFQTEKLKVNKSFNNSIVHSALGNESAISRMRTFRGGTELDADDFEQTQWAFVTGNDHFYQIDATWTNNTYNMLTPITNVDVQNSVAKPIVNFRYDSLRALITVEASATVDATPIKKSLHDYCENFSSSYPKILHVYMTLYERKKGAWTPLTVEGNKGIYIFNPSKYFAHTHMTGKTFTEGIIGRPMCVDYTRNTNKATIILLGKFNESDSRIHKDDINIVSADMDVYFNGSHAYFYKDYFEGFEEYAMRQCACFGIQFVTDSAYITTDIDSPDTPAEDIDNVYMGILDDNYVGHGDFVKGEKIFKNELYDKEADENAFVPEDTGDTGDLESFLHDLEGAGVGLDTFYVTPTNLSALLHWINTTSGETGQNFIDYVMGIKYSPYGFTSISSEQEIKIFGTATGVTGCKSLRWDYMESKSYYFTRRDNNFRDFAPYTKITLKVPFGDTITLDPAEWYGHSLQIQTRIDTVSGSGSAMIMRDNLQWCSVAINPCCDVPITAVLSGLYNNSIHTTRTYLNSATIQGIESSLQAGLHWYSPSALVSEGSNIANGLNFQSEYGYQLNHTTKHTSRIGSAGDMSDYCFDWRYNIIIERNKLDSEFDKTAYAKTTGFACCKSGKIGSESGMVVCSDVRISNCSLTKTEKDMIVQLCKTGIIV